MHRSIMLASLVVLAGSVNAQAPGASERNVRNALERIARIDPQLHSVIAIDPAAVGRARAFDASGRTIGLVAGQPVLIKDNIESAGPLPTTAGSLALANNVTGRDAPLGAPLGAAGAIVAG